MSKSKPILINRTRNKIALLCSIDAVARIQDTLCVSMTRKGVLDTRNTIQRIYRAETSKITILLMYNISQIMILKHVCYYLKQKLL